MSMRYTYKNIPELQESLQRDIDEGYSPSLTTVSDIIKILDECLKAKRAIKQIIQPVNRQAIIIENGLLAFENGETLDLKGVFNES